VRTEVRPAGADDAEAIASLANELSQELYGENEIDAGEVRHWLDTPDLGTFVATADGAVVGYADVRDEEHQRFPLDIRLAPSDRGQQASEALLGAVESWACERAQPDAIVRGVVGDRDAVLRARYEESGYRLIRHSFLMQIDLDGEAKPPEWPAAISVRSFEPGRDDARVYEAQQESFADHWDHHRTPFEEWRRQMLESPHFAPDLSLVAEENDEITGISLNAWHFSGDPGFGWVGILGVRRPWRRRGLGSALLRESFARFAERGATRVGLGVDAENTTGAVKLYERAGMRVVRRHDLYEKQLRL
jgi:mycothiol synthase